MAFALLLIHGLLAIFLLGAITHQALRLLWPIRRPDPGFVSALRAVNGQRYVNAVIVLFVATWVMGAVVYAPYRLEVKPVLEELNLASLNGVFEIKENIATIGLGLLPLYWLVWRRDRSALDRAVVTSLLCAIVWYGLLIGHVLNNFRGL